MLSDHTWMHIYGMGSPLLGLLLTFIVKRISAWLKIRKAKKEQTKKQIIKKALDEIETIASQPFNPLPFTKEAVECFMYFVCSFTMINIALINASNTNLVIQIINYLLHFTASAFLGLSLGALIELRRQLKIKLDPQKATERLRAMLEKLD